MAFDDSSPELSVVVPVYNNAATLRELHGRLQAVCRHNGIAQELIFVHDASPDNSLEVLRKLAAEDSHVKVLDLPRNVGQHIAVMAGLSHARGKWSVIMDADLQDPPEAIPLLLAAGNTGASAVFAGRRGCYESALRLLTSRAFKLMLHLLCRVPRDAGMFVAVKREMVVRLLQFRTTRPWIVAMIGCTGLPVRSIPVERSKRPAGVSSYSSWDRWRTAMRALACVLEHRYWPPQRAFLQACGPVALRSEECPPEEACVARDSPRRPGERRGSPASMPGEP